MKISFQNPIVTVFESELMQTTCTLVQQPDHLFLVDPNWLPSEVEYIANFVEKIIDGRRLYLLFTHSDYDHIIGYEKFRERASLIVSQALLDNPAQTEQLEAIQKFYDQYYLLPPWPISYPQEAQLAIASPKETHLIGNTSYQFFQAPGHNPDGLLTYLPGSGVLIVGDYVCGVEFPFIYDSVVAYQRTLHTLEKLLQNESIKVLIAGHGPVCTDPSEMRERLQEAQWYLDHLKAYGSNEVPFPEEKLWRRYPHYPIIQKTYHAANLELARKELGGG